jgi:hypothetical protein
VIGGPTASRSERHPGSPEAVGDDLRVDSESIGDIGKRLSRCVQLACFSERGVVPRWPFVMPQDVVSVEVGTDGGAVDAEVGCELASGGACLVRRDEVGDGGGGEAALGRV